MSDSNQHCALRCNNIVRRGKHDFKFTFVLFGSRQDYPFDPYIFCDDKRLYQSASQHPQLVSFSTIASTIDNALHNLDQSKICILTSSYLDPTRYINNLLTCFFPSSIALMQFQGSINQNHRKGNFSSHGFQVLNINTDLNQNKSKNGISCFQKN